MLCLLRSNRTVEVRNLPASLFSMHCFVEKQIIRNRLRNLNSQQEPLCKSRAFVYVSSVIPVLVQTFVSQRS